MKYFSLLFVVLFFSACSKEEVYGPYKLKNGQEVELLVDHRYAAIGETLLILPQNKPTNMFLNGFPDRKPGYSYHVKARFNVVQDPPQDGSDRWFNLISVTSEEKYQGNQPFEIRLIQAIVPGPPTITMGKKDDQYLYIQDKLELTYTSQVVKDQLEEIWQHAKDIRESEVINHQRVPLRWKSITATVTHDPNKFGTAYLVQKIVFTE